MVTKVELRTKAYIKSTFIKKFHNARSQTLGKRRISLIFIFFEYDSFKQIGVSSIENSFIIRYKMYDKTLDKIQIARLKGTEKVFYIP